MTVDRYDDELRAFRTVLKTRRQRLGFRIQDAALRSGLSEAGISRIENGNRLPDMTTVMALSHAYGLRVVVWEGKVWAEVPE